jgi:hypothetical protein
MFACFSYKLIYGSQNYTHVYFFILSNKKAFYFCIYCIYPRYLERMVCQLIPATMQLRDSKTNARCDISGTVTELSNVKWNDKKVK